MFFFQIVHQMFVYQPIVQKKTTKFQCQKTLQLFIIKNIVPKIRSVDKARVPNLTIQILNTESNSYRQRQIGEQSLVSQKYANTQHVGIKKM